MIAHMFSFYDRPRRVLALGAPTISTFCSAPARTTIVAMPALKRLMGLSGPDGFLISTSDISRPYWIMSSMGVMQRDTLFSLV